MNKTKFNIKIKGDPFLRKYHVKDYEVREYNTQLYINHNTDISLSANIRDSIADVKKDIVKDTVYKTISKDLAESFKAKYKKLLIASEKSTEEEFIEANEAKIQEIVESLANEFNMKTKGLTLLFVVDEEDDISIIKEKKSKNSQHFSTLDVSFDDAYPHGLVDGGHTFNVIKSLSEYSTKKDGLQNPFKTLFSRSENFSFPVKATIFFIKKLHEVEKKQIENFINNIALAHNTNKNVARRQLVAVKSDFAKKIQEQIAFWNLDEGVRFEETNSLKSVSANMDIASYLLFVKGGLECNGDIKECLKNLYYNELRRIQELDEDTQIKLIESVNYKNIWRYFVRNAGENIISKVKWKLAIGLFFYFLKEKKELLRYLTEDIETLMNGEPEMEQFLLIDEIFSSIVIFYDKMIKLGIVGLWQFELEDFDLNELKSKIDKLENLLVLA